MLRTLTRGSSLPVGELLGEGRDPFHQAQDEVFGGEPAPEITTPPMPLRQFIAEGWHVVEPEMPFRPNWHVDAIAEHLEWVAAGEILRLLINIGPGYAKSLIVSVFWPAWMWTYRAGWRSIFSSYDLTLSTRDTVRSRSVLTSDWYRELFRPTWRLSSDQNVKSYYRNTRMGERLATSVAGASTGFRGDATIFDDAVSATDRHKEERHAASIDWWLKVMSSRLNDQQTGVRVGVMQRLHEKDLSGHLIAAGGYQHLCLPTEFDPKRRSVTVTKSGQAWQDPRTTEGELLFPALFPRAVVEQIKIDLGTWDYSAQHQQQALPSSGGIFERPWFTFYRRRDVPVLWHETLQSWDLTFKKKEDSDFVVGQVWSRFGTNCYLRFEKRGRMGFGESKRAVRAVSAAYPEATAKLVEEKANGAALLEELKDELEGLIAVNDDGVLEQAWAIQPLVEAGQIFVPDPADWPEVEEWLDEVCAFPKAVHDDRVAAFTQAIQRLKRHMRRSPAAPPAAATPSEAVTVARQKF
jgi:predicted phage terminase large subunit-like protein